MAVIAWAYVAVTFIACGVALAVWDDQPVVGIISALFWPIASLVVVGFKIGKRFERAIR